MLNSASEILIFIEREFHNKWAPLYFVHLAEHAVIDVPQSDARLTELLRRTRAVLDYRP
jgi:hypothetical protein